MKILTHILISVFVLSCSNLKPTEKKYEIGQINTPMGEMLFWMYDDTPTHKASFIKLAKSGYWDTLTFNRVIENFVIQGGCPDTPEGFGDSPYLLQPEFRDHIKHIYGAVGIGRDDNPEKLSAGCQFYIVHDKNGIPRLDNNYMIFGQLFKGFDVLNEIAMVKTDTLDQPIVDVSLDVNILNLSEAQLMEKGFSLEQLNTNH